MATKGKKFKFSVTVTIRSANKTVSKKTYTAEVVAANEEAAIEAAKKAVAEQHLKGYKQVFSKGRVAMYKKDKMLAFIGVRK